MKHDIQKISLAQIVEWKREDFLRKNNEYQRGAVWSKKHQKLLVDSILRGYPIPLLYFHFIERGSGSLTRRAYEIIDGQQRINAITDFVGNSFKLFDFSTEDVTGLPRFLKNEACPWGGKTYEALPVVFQEQLMQTEVNVAIITSNDSNEVRELFVRLQGGLPLNPQEKRDAWPGSFTDFVVKTAGKPPEIIGHDFFSTVLKSPSPIRGGARQACAALFMTLGARRETFSADAFVSLNNAQIDEFYHHHLDMNPTDPLFRRFRDILDIAADVLGTNGRKLLQFHAGLHTLLLIDSLMDDFAPTWKKKLPEALDEFLLQLALATKAAREGSETVLPYWSEYGSRARANAVEKNTIHARHRFFVREMLSLMKPLQRRDPKRGYSLAERELLYLSQKKNCEICGEVVDWPDLEAHHLEPHTDGGATTLDNAALVHKWCHPRGPNSHGPNREKLPSEAKPSMTAKPAWALDDADDVPDLDDEGDEKPRKPGQRVRVAITKDGKTEKFPSINMARRFVYETLYGQPPEHGANAATCTDFLNKHGYTVVEE